MAVLRPLRVVIENYPEGQGEELDAMNNPEDPASGTRKMPFCRVLYIEQEDFREDPPKKFFRLARGVKSVCGMRTSSRAKKLSRMRSGNIIELRCTYDPATRGGDSPGWPSRKRRCTGFRRRMPFRGSPALRSAVQRRTAGQRISHQSEFTRNRAGNPVEPSLKAAKPGERFQFERLGYFCVDPDSKPDALVFNRTVTLRDTWAKIEKSLKT